MLGGALVLATVSGLFGVSYVLAAFLPSSFALPTAARVVGGTVVLGGLWLAVWTLKYREPRVMIVSTYYTLAKAMGRTQISEMGGREERLVVDGPQKYVRSPLYLAVVSIIFGWGLVTGSALFFIATVVFFLWFSLALIPFEERELAALFGEEWKEYSEVTPMLIPFLKRKAPPGSGPGRPAKE